MISFQPILPLEKLVMDDADNKARRISWLAWLPGLLYALLLFPTLNQTRLHDVDELTHARVAQDLALRGEWLPLRLEGKPWFFKPPLTIWAAAGLARLAGPYESWPYRFSTCLGAVLCVLFLALIGAQIGQVKAGILAACLFAFQGDTIFHARYMTMDTGVLACLLGALWALLKGKDACAAWALALGVWIKSLFVVSFLPPLLLGLWLTRARRPALQGALWLLGGVALGLASWLGLHLKVYGHDFWAWEFHSDLLGRAIYPIMNERVGSNWDFYTNWGGLSAGGLLPLAVAASASLWPRRRENLALSLAVIFPPYWFLVLAGIQSQVFNYLVPVEGFVALAAALWFFAKPKGFEALLAAALWALTLGLPWHGRAAAYLFGASLLAGLALAAGWLRAYPRPHWAGSALGVALALSLGLQSYKSVKYIFHHEDPLRPMVDVLLAHPARKAGEPLYLIGLNTQAASFYSNYEVHLLPELPAQQPQGAALVSTKEGWKFFEAPSKPK